jgi:hypothetical protein
MNHSKQNIGVLLERSSKRLAELHARSQNVHKHLSPLPHEQSLRKARETLGKATGAFAVSDFPEVEGHLLEMTIHLDTAERLLKRRD